MALGRQDKFEQDFFNVQGNEAQTILYVRGVRTLNKKPPALNNEQSGSRHHGDLDDVVGYLRSWKGVGSMAMYKSSEMEHSHQSFK